MKYLIIPVIFLGMMISGCSSSSSGGSSAPAGNYSGDYTIARDSGSADRWTFSGELNVVQNGNDAALHYKDYSWKVEPVIDEEELREEYDVDLVYVLRGTGVGRVSGRSIDVRWDDGTGVRMEFNSEGTAFSAIGDFSFAGVKQ